MGGDGRVVDSVAVRAEVPVVSERHMEEVPVEVLEAVVVSAADSVAVPALAAYRTDNTENKAVVPASAEVLEASVEGLAYACDHRSRPA